MAEDTRHAAWHDKREFSVRLIPVDGPARDLITGFTDFLAAVDYVTEWLDREDPSCTDEQRLVIVQTEGGVGSEVFSYPPPDEPDSSQDLIQVYGFNPAAPRFRPGEHTKPKLDRLSNRIARAPATPAPPPTNHVLPAPTVVEPDDPAPVTITARELAGPTWRVSRHSLQAAFRLIWDDKVARGCLVVAALSLWLTVTLADPVFLVPLLASGTALWYLHHRRPIPDSDADEWF